MTEQEKYLTAFSTVPNIGPKRLALILNYFGSAIDAWKASGEIWHKIGLPEAVVNEFLGQRKVLNVDKFLTGLLEKEINIIVYDSQDYPERLKKISDAPFVLFIKSKKYSRELAKWTHSRTLGVVGTRKMTSYGSEITRQLTGDLVRYGFTIVSGMALGVDGTAHQATLDFKGRTIAVLGAGVDIIYPPEHRHLYEQIFNEGIIISEVAPGKTVNKGIFPARNRIISGLSEGVLVTEGTLDSGSLITAKLAVEQGREVFAVPGPINSLLAQGTNHLLKEGAKLVTSANDICETLGYETAHLSGRNFDAIKGEDEYEQKVIDLLKTGAKEFDQMIRELGWDSAKGGSVVTILEIRKIIRRTGQTLYLN